MANDQFEKLLRFARRTGDRLIVTDDQGGEPLVILPFEQYESLVNGFLGPDDGEIAVHEHEHEQPFEPEFASEEEEIGEIEIDQAFLTQQAEAVLEVIEPSSNTHLEPEPRPIPPAVQKAPELPHQPPTQAQNHGGEEQFYLEPL